MDEINKFCLETWVNGAYTQNCNFCTCENGSPAPAAGSGALCETNGAEDCSTCNAGYGINAPVRDGLQCPPSPRTSHISIDMEDAASLNHPRALTGRRWFSDV